MIIRDLSLMTTITAVAIAIAVAAVFSLSQCHEKEG